MAPHVLQRCALLPRLIAQHVTNPHFLPDLRIGRCVLVGEVGAGLHTGPAGLGAAPRIINLLVVRPPLVRKLELPVLHRCCDGRWRGPAVGRPVALGLDLAATEALGPLRRQLLERRLIPEEGHLCDTLGLVGPGERRVSDLGVVGPHLGDGRRMRSPDLVVRLLRGGHQHADEIEGLLDERWRVGDTEALLDGQRVVARVILVVEEGACGHALGDETVELEAVVHVPEALGPVLVVEVRVLAAVLDGVAELDLLLEPLRVGVKVRAEVLDAVVPVEEREVLKCLRVGTEPRVVRRRRLAVHLGGDLGDTCVSGEELRRNGEGATRSDPLVTEADLEVTSCLALLLEVEESEDVEDGQRSDLSGLELLAESSDLSLELVVALGRVAGCRDLTEIVALLTLKVTSPRLGDAPVAIHRLELLTLGLVGLTEAEDVRGSGHFVR